MDEHTPNSDVAVNNEANNDAVLTLLERIACAVEHLAGALAGHVPATKDSASE